MWVIEYWAKCIAAGIPDELFRRSTPQEMELVMHAVAERDRAANMRAALITAAVINSNPFRKKSARTVSPYDFINEGKMTVEEAKRLIERSYTRKERKK